MALLLSVPLARRHGIRMLPWVVLTVATGSIGLLALVARLLYAQEANTATETSAGQALAPTAQRPGAG